ncbi:DUF4287 domain-containing protein [Nocardia sp. NPDC050710]|uniref:DUF4287 domain-containing protein n=1 Tax=Nocardia sp. NPDC050710 TaxID=3157220 RepID=UPI0033F3A9BD
MATKPHGPASYFPSIEAKYGRTIAEWKSAMTDSGRTTFKDLVAWLKTEHGFGHGHATAITQHHLNPEKWAV